MAPVLTIGEDVYGNVKLSEVEKIMNKYMENK
jgi:NADH:ubiquinone oxidoreductase subunit E